MSRNPLKNQQNGQTTGSPKEEGGETINPQSAHDTGDNDLWEGRGKMSPTESTLLTSEKITLKF